MARARVLEIGACFLATEGTEIIFVFLWVLCGKRERFPTLSISCLSRLAKDPARLATRLGIALYLLGSLAYLFLGQVNGDEGWYLYTSKLILQGALPYRDVAYTQMPLIPYVYGVLQIVYPSMYLGRLTSIVISIGTLLMGIVVARRYAGARASGIAALLFAAFVYGIYFNSIIKTYALLSFSFTATLFVLSSNLQDTRKYPLALLFAMAGALTRITAPLFVAPILLYVVIAAPGWKTRALILLECAAAALLIGFFVLSDWQAARWGLFDSHLRHWAGAGISTQINYILSQRLTDIAQQFGLVLALFVASVYFILRDQGLARAQRNCLPIWITALGLGLFAASHLVNGLWDAEYFVPAVTAFLPIVAIVLSQVYGEQESQSRVFFQGTLLAVLLLLPLTESIQHIDFTGRRLPLSELDEVAAFVAQHSQPTDQVFALEALDTVVIAHRSVLPGLTLGQFSVQLMDAPTAQRLHVVNAAMVADAVSQRKVQVIVLTERDFGLMDLMDIGSGAALRRALDREYKLALTVPLFGAYARPVNVYLLRQ